MRNLSRLLCIVLTSFTILARGQSTLHTITETGPPAERLNIVLLSEGYTAAELSSGKFTTDAQTISNALLTTEPFKSYRPFFNVYGISIASAQSGGDLGSAGGYVNTYFNSSFNSYGIDRLLTIDSTGSARAYALLNTHVPLYDIVLVVVNDSKYGGSGGALAVTSTNISAPEIAIHEIGHSFGGLGDEYDYAGSSASETPNTTQETNRANLKWKLWVNAPTPIPTPETATYGGGLVGLFEGAAYHTTGWYRPTLTSKMESLNEPFYAVNEEALVLSMYQRLSPITSVVPAGNTVTVTQPDQALNFQVKGPSTAATAPAITVQWQLNGTPIVGQVGRTLTLQSSALGNGSFTLKAAVHDPTTKVRKSTTLLDAEHTWTLALSGQGPEAPEALNASVDEDGSVALTWEDKSDDEAQFAIERANATGAFAEVARVPANSTSYTDPGPAVTGRRYRVSGVNSVTPTLLGPPSNVVTMTSASVATSPASVTLVYGQTLTLNVTAKGTGLIRYQWRFNQQNIGGETSDSLMLADRQSMDAGNYDCVVSNAFSSATSKAAKVTVLGPPYVTIPPSSQSVLRGQTVIFNVSAEGTATLTYQWRRDGVPIAAATTSKLILTSVKDSDVAIYDCVVSNGYGSDGSAPASLSFNLSTVTDPELVGKRAGLAKWQWTQRLGGTAEDDLSALTWSENKLIAAGHSTAAGAKFGTLTLNAADTWTARFHPVTGKAELLMDVPAAVQLLALAPGEPDSLLAGGLSPAGSYLARYPLNGGAIPWIQSRGPGGRQVTDCVRGADGSLYSIDQSADGVTSILLKMQPDGTVIWERQMHALTLRAEGIYVDASDRIYVCGIAATDDATDFQFSNPDPLPPTVIDTTADKSGGFVACYDAGGTVQWAGLYGDDVLSLSAGKAGSICAAGRETDVTSKPGIWMLNSTTGAVQTHFATGKGRLLDGTTTPGGEVAVLLRDELMTRAAGAFEEASPGWVLAKYSATGELLWVLPVKADTSAAGSSRGSVVSAPDGRLFVGFTAGPGLKAEFAGLAPVVMTGRASDGFLACATETGQVAAPPVPVMSVLGTMIHLAADVGGMAGTVGYQWLKDGKVLPGQTQASLDIATSKTTDAGGYSVRVIGTGGTTDSAKTAVNVINTTPRTLSAPTGKVLDLPVTAAGPGLTFTWWRNGVRVFNTGAFSNSTTSKLRINSMSPAFVDSYVCKVSGAGGVLEVPFTTGIMYAPVFTTPVVPAAVVSGTFNLQLNASQATTYSVKNLPPGLTYDPKTGLITGKPTGTASRVVSVTASNAAGASYPALVFVINVNDLAAHAKGGFQSLVTRQPWNAGLGGFLVTNVGSTGAVTGSLRFAGATHPLTGKVDGNAATLGWVFHQRIARSGKPALLLTLNSPPAQDGEVTGAIALEAPSPETATTSGRQTVWKSPRLPTAFAGTFNATLTLPAMLVGDNSVPQGTGTMKTIVNATTGVASWSGKLSDNISFSGSSAVWPGGSVPQWLALYSNLGSLLGSPVISGSQQTGELEWTRNPKTGAPSWAAFPLTVTGSK